MIERIGFPVCPECNGWSRVEADNANMGWKSCPSCVEGSVITDELVEGVREAVLALGGYISTQQARAVLTAVLRHLKEKEQ